MIENRHQRKLLTPLRKRIGLAVLFFALFVISLFIGADKNVNIGQLWRLDSGAWQVFLVSRLPRTMAIVLTASGLSVSGLIMHPCDCKHQL